MSPINVDFKGPKVVLSGHTGGSLVRDCCSQPLERHTPQTKRNAPSIDTSPATLNELSPQLDYEPKRCEVAASCQLATARATRFQLHRSWLRWNYELLRTVPSLNTKRHVPQHDLGPLHRKHPRMQPCLSWHAQLVLEPGIKSVNAVNAPTCMRINKPQASATQCQRLLQWVEVTC